MSAHTPGPWVTYQKPGAGGLHYGIRSFDASNPQIARVYSAPRPGQAEANARLIAASPCLAEALRQLVGNAEAAAKYVRGENDIVASALFDTIEQALVALAKAGASQ